MIGAFKLISLAAAKKRQASGGGVAHRYFRLYVTAAGNASGSVDLAEVSYFAAGIAHPLVAMTNVASPPPYTASSTGQSASFYAWKAFDNASNTYHINAGGVPHSLTLDLGSEVACDSISIQARTDAMIDFNSYPKDFQVQASNTGAFAGEEVVLFSASGETWAVLETRVFNF